MHVGMRSPWPWPPEARGSPAWPAEGTLVPCRRCSAGDLHQEAAGSRGWMEQDGASSVHPPLRGASGPDAGTLGPQQPVGEGDRHPVSPTHRSSAPQPCALFGSPRGGSCVVPNQSALTEHHCSSARPQGGPHMAPVAPPNLQQVCPIHGHQP